MPLVVRCPLCQKPCGLPEGFAGQARCPGCGKPFGVPAAEPAPLAELIEEPPPRRKPVPIPLWAWAVSVAGTLLLLGGCAGVVALYILNPPQPPDDKVYESGVTELNAGYRANQAAQAKQKVGKRFRIRGIVKMVVDDLGTPTALVSSHSGVETLWCGFAPQSHRAAEQLFAGQSVTLVGTLKHGFQRPNLTDCVLEASSAR